MTDNTHGAVPEIARLSSFERRVAVRRYQQWYERGASKGFAEPDLRGMTLRLTYVSVAQLWLGCATPFGFVAAAFWSLRENSLQVGCALGLTLVTVAFLSMLALRWQQGTKYWPRPVRLNRRA